MNYKRLGLILIAALILAGAVYAYIYYDYTLDGSSATLSNNIEQSSLSQKIEPPAISEPSQPSPQTPPSPIKLDSGIEGKVVIGPACPGPVHQDQPCPDQPYSAKMVVKSADGKIVTSFTSAADGSFAVAVAPGNYVIEAADQPTSPRNPSFGPHTVAVQAHRYTHVTLTFDSGIR